MDVESYRRLVKDVGSTPRRYLRCPELAKFAFHDKQISEEILLYYLPVRLPTLVNGLVKV